MNKIIFILLIALSFNAFAQDTDSVQKKRPDFILSANLSGDISLLALGLEKFVFLKPGFALGIGVGFGFNQEFQIFSNDDIANYFILPHHVTCNFGKNKSFLEFGLGAAFVTSGEDNYYLAYPVLGYRLHPFKNPGFSFRAWLYYPLGQQSNINDIDVLFTPVGLSFGIAL